MNRKRVIIHVEIPSRNPEKSGRFYRELFGWKITQIPNMNYVVWETEGVGGSRGGFIPLNEDVKVGNMLI